MTYRNQCKLRRYRRRLKRQRDILASLTPWQRWILDSVMRGDCTLMAAYSRSYGRHLLARRAEQLHATGYKPGGTMSGFTPLVEWRDEV